MPVPPAWRKTSTVISQWTLVGSFTAYAGFLGGAFDGGTGTTAPEDIRYQYDHHNQLTRVEFYDINGNLSKAVEYDYDVFGRRIAKYVDSDGNGTFDSAQKFVYDSSGKTDPATGVALDDVVLVFDISNTLKDRYLHGPAIDQVFADEDALGNILLGPHRPPRHGAGRGGLRRWVEYHNCCRSPAV